LQADLEITNIENLMQFERTFLASSFFASKMLFWAAMIPEIEDEIVSEILRDHPAYPEAPMYLKDN